MLRLVCIISENQIILLLIPGGVPWILNRTPGQVVYTLDRNQHGHMQQLVPHQKAHSPEIDINPHKASRSHPQAWQHPHMESTYFYNWPWRLTEIHYLMNERKIPLDKIHEVYPSIWNWMDFYVSLRWSKEEKVQKILSDLGIWLWGVRNAGTEDIQEWLKAVYIWAMPDQKYPGTNAIRLSINATMNDTGITPVFVHSNHWLLLMSLPPQLQ